MNINIHVTYTFVGLLSSSPDQGFGMICLIMYTQPISLFIQEEVENLSLCKRLPTVVFLVNLSLWCQPCNVSDLTIMISDFLHFTL